MDTISVLNNEHNSTVYDTSRDTNVLRKELVYTEDVERDYSDYIIINYKEHRSYFVIKRLMDMIFSIIALIILTPLFLCIIIAIRIETKGKAIFSQSRTGKNGKEFKMYKFRSMYNDAEQWRQKLLEQNEMDGPVFKIAKDPRVTKVGRFIRKTSIDELPQLINIIKGDMSIVGPRPLVIYETEEFDYYENLRHQVKPGLTCYWQINGRNDVSFHRWIRLDMKYLKEMNLWTDLKIIMKTFGVVFTGKGAY